MVLGNRVNRNVPFIILIQKSTEKAANSARQIHSIYVKYRYRGYMRYREGVMYNQIIVLALSMVLGAASPEMTVPKDPFVAKVSAVYHGDALRLDVGDARYLVTLYGVRSNPLDLAKMKEAEKFIASITKDVSLEVRLVKVISGLSYVEAILPSGEVLNKLVLEKDLAGLDTLSAGDDAAYKDIASKAKEHKLNTENVQNDPAHDTAKDEKPQDPGQALANFKVKKQLLEIAQFEGEVEKWGALPEAYRRSIAASYGFTLQSGAARLSQETIRRQQKAEGTAQKLEDNQARIAAHQEAIASVTASEQAALADVYDDFDLNWDQGMAKGFHKNLLAEVATGDEYSASIDAHLLDEYNYKVMLDRSRVDSEAAAVSAAHESARQAHRGEIANIQSQHNSIIAMIRRAEARAQAATSIAAKHEQRYTDALQHIQALDEAVSQNYEPSLIPVVSERFQGDRTEQFAKFPIESVIWRIDWYVKKLQTDASFSIDIYNAKDDKFLRHIITEREPYEAFALCEDPGEYYLKVNAGGVIEFIVAIVQFGQN